MSRKNLYEYSGKTEQGREIYIFILAYGVQGATAIANDKMREDGLDITFNSSDAMCLGDRIDRRRAAQIVTSAGIFTTGLNLLRTCLTGRR